MANEITLEEALAMADVSEEASPVCIIDSNTRIINVPTEFQLLGVESDEKVKRINFICPRIVGDNIDLTTLNLYVNYKNANNEFNTYWIDDVTEVGDNITFSWVLSRHVTKYQGDVSYIVCAKKSDGTNITNEWNTKIATGEVVKGLEGVAEVEEQNIDLIEQILVKLNTIIVNIGIKPTTFTSFKDIQNNVRLGRGPMYYPVGSEIKTRDSVTEQDIIWVVRAHDHHKAADSSIEHTMTIETKYVYSSPNNLAYSVSYDAPEAFYFAENGLVAGTYNFTASKRRFYTSDNGNKFQFTLTQDVPAGGQLVLNTTYSKSLNGIAIKSYINGSSIDPIETVTLSKGSEGTNLGITDGTSKNINYIRRIECGSNNYAQSAVRQWLNSANDVGQVWTPMTKYDRPPEWTKNYSGFMQRLPSDFLEIVQPAIIPCCTNSVFETDNLDGTSVAINQVYNLSDKFFLLSRPEITGGWNDPKLKDGVQLEYYKNLSFTENIRYDMTGVKRSIVCRSPITTAPEYITTIDVQGVQYQGFATDGMISPACIIA